MRNMRHTVTVKRPRAGSLGTLGQSQGGDETVYEHWPCSIETLSGREFEIARQQFNDATLRVKGYTSREKPITPKDYLLFGARRLDVGFVNDVDQLGLIAECLCVEAK